MSEKLELETNFITDIRKIIDEGKASAYAAVSKAMIATYWSIGRRIVEQEQNGNSRAEYGERLIERLSEILTHDYGKGFSPRNIREFRTFYKKFPDMEIWHTRVPNLTWSHYRTLLRVETPQIREWYMNEASHENWSVRTLDRNIQTQYFERRLAAQKKNTELPVPTSDKNTDHLDFIKNPLVTEFLGLERPHSFNESQYRAGKAVNAEQLSLYYGIGRYISFNSRNDAWGTSDKIVTCKTSADMPEKFRKALPPIEEMRKLLKANQEGVQ